jgi:hypothetical protein
MSDKFFPDISVGDFAMDILKSMDNDPNKFKPSYKESTLASADAPDISKVTVPDEFIQSITEGKAYKAKPKKLKVIKESSEVRLSNLIVELSELISEARSILEECGTTSVGNIGTGSSLKSKIKNRIKKRPR